MHVYRIGVPNCGLSLEKEQLEDQRERSQSVTYIFPNKNKLAVDGILSFNSRRLSILQLDDKAYFSGSLHPKVRQWLLLRGLHWLRPLFEHGIKDALPWNGNKNIKAGLVALSINQSLKNVFEACYSYAWPHKKPQTFWLSFSVLLGFVGGGYKQIQHIA